MNTKLTIKEMTTRYNEMAADLSLPIVKKLKPTKEFKTVANRYDAMVTLHAINVTGACAQPADTRLTKHRTLANPMETVVTPPHRANRKPLNPVAKADINLPSQKEVTAHRTEVTGIKHTRPGTSIYYVIEALLIGGTVHELSEYLKNNDVNWTENSLRAALSWDVPKKGYEVEKFTHENGTRYKISNANAVV